MVVLLKRRLGARPLAMAVEEEREDWTAEDAEGFNCKEVISFVEEYSKEVKLKTKEIEKLTKQVRSRITDGQRLKEDFEALTRRAQKILESSTLFRRALEKESFRIPVSASKKQREKRKRDEKIVRITGDAKEFVELKRRRRWSGMRKKALF
jgi:regulator of replication initiation timing